jgi:hypothetical protein
MGQIEELDQLAEQLLEQEIEDCLLGRKPIPQWLKDSLERGTKGESQEVDDDIDSGIDERGD